MAQKTKLDPMVSWDRMHVTETDWTTTDTDLLSRMLTVMELARQFDQVAAKLWENGLVHGPVHTSIGQEAVAAGIVSCLESGDLVSYPHRAHHHFLAKALFHLGQPEGFTVDDAARAAIKRTLAEIMGLEQGWCRGRGGSMHLYWREAGILGANAIIGAGLPHAVGMASALKRRNSDNCVVAYFGDGAVQQGGTLEALSLAAGFDVPVCFVVENNLYAVATHIEEVVKEPRLSGRGIGLGIPGISVDGMDAVAVRAAMMEAVAWMRDGKGPFLIEALTYRYLHQNGPAAGSAFGYRTKEEEQAWKARDPIVQAHEQLSLRNDIDRSGLEALSDYVTALLTEIVDELIETHDGERRIIPSLWPDPQDADRGVRGDLSEFDGARYQEEKAYAGAWQTKKFSEAIAASIQRNMADDDRVLIMGEDIQHLKGGTNGATKGLAETFPDRVIGTPIAELGFLGMAIGMAMQGSLRPIVEFMYADFAWVAADQVINQASKARQMYGGEDPVPLVLRTKIAIGTGYGSQHSMDPVGFFAMAPGWRIVAPRTAYDYIGLMNSAIRCQDPVLVVEHVSNYAKSVPVPVDAIDYLIPMGKAHTVREGQDVTIVGYLTMVDMALDAAEELGIDAEIIDLRSLDWAGIDWETIGASIQKTNNVLIVEEGPRSTSYGASLADELHRRYFDYLDQPVKRLHGLETAPAVSKVLETATHATGSDMRHALIDVMRDVGRWPLDAA